jgi:ATP-dependent DNA helicase RecQ
VAKSIHQLLKSHWGFDSFRSKQQDIIESVLAGKDTLALLPTGGGKSVCFQIPGLYLGGCTLVVSPLIALMKDQVRQLKKLGINADCLVSGMSKTAIDRHWIIVFMEIQSFYMYRQSD